MTPEEAIARWDGFLAKIDARAKEKGVASVDAPVVSLSFTDDEYMSARNTESIHGFYVKAPRFHPNASLITGVVCGVRVEEVEGETMRKIRTLDKLIDELAKGRAMEKILRK